MKQNEVENNDKEEGKKEDISKDEDLMADIVENYGIGWITIKIFLIPFIFHIVEGVHLNMYATLIIPMKEYYNFTPMQEKFIPTTFFMGAVVGSLSLGKMCSITSRMFVLKLSGLILLIGNFLLIGFEKNSTVFMISRLTCGLSIGYSMPITLNLITEYSPIHKRGTLFLLSILGFTVGGVYQLLVILKVMPNYEASKLQQVYLYTFIPTALYFVTMLLFARDSPRALFLKEKFDDGFEILDEYKGSKLTDEEKEKIKNKLKGISDNKNISSPYTELFKGEFLKITILLLIIAVGRGMHYNGVMTVSSLTMKQIGTETIQKTNNEVIWEEIYMNLIIFPCYILGGIISEIKFLGRKYLMIISFTLCLINLCLAIINPLLFSVFIGVCILLSNLGGGIASNYLSEVYPTSHRDSAYGFIFAFLRFGSVISNFIFLSLNEKGVWLPYYFDILILLIMIVCFFLLPIETCGKALDSMSSITNKNSEMIKSKNSKGTLEDGEINDNKESNDKLLDNKNDNNPTSITVENDCDGVDGSDEKKKLLNDQN